MGGMTLSGTHCIVDLGAHCTCSIRDTTSVATKQARKRDHLENHSHAGKLSLAPIAKYSN